MWISTSAIVLLLTTPAAASPDSNVAVILQRQTQELLDAITSARPTCGSGISIPR